MVEAVIEKNDYSGEAPASAAENLKRIAALDTDSLDTMEIAIEAIRTAMRHWEPETI